MKINRAQSKQKLLVKDDLEALTIRIPVELFEKLKEYTDKNNYSINYSCFVIIKKFFDLEAAQASQAAQSDQAPSTTQAIRKKRQ